VLILLYNFYLFFTRKGGQAVVFMKT